MTKRAVQDAVNVADGARRQRLAVLAAAQFGVEFIQVDGAKLLQLDVADMPDDMLAQQFEIAF